MGHCSKSGKKNTKQSTVFNPFSPSRLFRVKGEAGYSLLFPPGEEGIGEQHGAWGMGRTLKRVGGGGGDAERTRRGEEGC